MWRLKKQHRRPSDGRSFFSLSLFLWIGEFVAPMRRRLVDSLVDTFRNKYDYGWLVSLSLILWISHSPSMHQQCVYACPCPNTMEINNNNTAERAMANRMNDCRMYKWMFSNANKTQLELFKSPVWRVVHVFDFIFFSAAVKGSALYRVNAETETIRHTHIHTRSLSPSLSLLSFATKGQNKLLRALRCTLPPLPPYANILPRHIAHTHTRMLCSTNHCRLPFKQMPFVVFPRYGGVFGSWYTRVAPRT